MKILIAVDGSPTTKRMLAYLVAHEERFLRGQALTVFTAVPAVPARAASLFDKDSLQGYYEEEAEKVFKPIRSFLSKQGVEAKFLSKVGHAAELIAKASAKQDLLILGSHGHTALGNLVMGSVATKVLAGCETPVLLVR
ncbi:universal stress protein [Piscinibacter sp. Jin2]|uniref:Universal stress protein n=1 Tax=Aquariibacter lacus TaxID=2801332 RepID=A0A9X1BMU2_9BURK|nr:universal stress protein [Piscinibacter lacus]MBL0718652.1 universal stress protein [Piscinibacter lacus]